MASSSSQSTQVTAVLGRLTWMLFGPFLLALTTFALFDRNKGLLTLVDFAFFAVVGSMMLGRWVEFRTGTATTAEGSPATAHDLRRYCLIAGAVGLAVWAATLLFRGMLGSAW